MFQAGLLCGRARGTETESERREPEGERRETPRERVIAWLDWMHESDNSWASHQHELSRPPSEV